MAIKSVDAVALELNPDTWQGQMVRLNKLKQNYMDFVQAAPADFVNENSFRIGRYDDELKWAMSTEPTVVNSLLYRSFRSKEDFEESTFLDLYIFQTGKKLGKRSTGVENYFETEKLIMEAYADMAMEKKKRAIDTDGESMDNIEEKMQDAYRKGDLDLMDSLDRMMDHSDAFREKFLYRRNKIQANSIDTILQKNSLFVGVGAAHLAGDRGVIELLRKKGYHLRPVQMAKRDASQKEFIDQMKVPVEFIKCVSEDSLYSLDMPGPLFKLAGDNQGLDRRQYSDMSNGAYYLVTRVRIHAAFLGQNAGTVLKRVDSLLYENIPGKILSKKSITKSGYPGFDITNRTRRGDLQRYNIIVTPFEVLLFKMSGNENYVAGREAERFFSSIHLKEAGAPPLVFHPGQGGFSVKFPGLPGAYLNTASSDNINRWEYDAEDGSTDDAYLIFKKNVNNFRFLDEDSFNLSMMEASFRNPDHFDKQLLRGPRTFNGYPGLEIHDQMKDGSQVHALFVIRGPEYYVISARSKNKQFDFGTFLETFHFTTYEYPPAAMYVDTFMHFSVATPVTPDMDSGLRRLIEKTTNDITNGNNASGYIPYWPKPRNGLFRSDSTGEMIGVSVQEFPKYYYIKDPCKFWKDELESHTKSDMVLYSSEWIKPVNGVSGYRITLRDSGSSATINRLILLKDDLLYNLVSPGDTLTPQSDFIRSFYATFQPLDKKPARSVFDNPLDDFFADLFSSDSSVHRKAQQFISNIFYGEKGIPKIMEAIGKLNLSDKDYFETKTKLIAELGYIKDTSKPVVVEYLKKIYEQTADTSLFQDEVLIALARHKTRAAYVLLKTLLLQDPPQFESKYEYNGLFNNLNDSLALTKILFPDLLQLSSMNDYKEKILSLLVTLVDSNMIRADEYEQYFSKIYFDARIELKKQLGKDEKKMEQDSKKEEVDISSLRFNSYGNESLKDYQVLLMPFYEKNNNVPRFFEKLLRSKDPLVRLSTAVLLLRNNKMVADNILQSLAASDRFRGKLFSALELAKRLDKFPVQFRNQTAIARSYLLADKDYAKIDSVAYLEKQAVAYGNKKGMVYFFKYRVNKEDDWKIGISGLQPINETEVSSDNKLAVMTDKKLMRDEPVMEQFQKQLKKLLFTFHKSGKNFFTQDDYYDRFKKADDYGD